MDPRHHHHQGEDHEIGEGEMQADPVKGIEAMKNKLKEIEDEAAALKVMQAQVSREITSAQDLDDAAAIQAKKEESDSRSIYVGNVDYACTPEEIQQHFQSCGTVNRITIRTDKFGQPKGFAYVEFEEIDAVQNALMLNESELHGRQLKVSAKRTNIPGMKQYRARRPNPCVAFVSYTPHPFYPTNVYGRSPRYRRPARFRPY